MANGYNPIQPIPGPSVEAPTAAEFRTEFPAFADDTAYPDAMINRLAEVALSIHALNEMANRYCLAHLLVVEGQHSTVADAGVGEVASEGIGKKRTSYKTQAANAREVFFSTTSYGRSFLTLERRTPARVFPRVF